MFLTGKLDRGSTVWLLLMSSMLFILLLPISSYVAVLPFIKDEWFLNNTQAGVLFSSSLVGYAISALFVVPLTDRIGARRLLIVSAFISVLVHTLFPLVANGLVLGLLLRFISGAGFLGVYVPGLRLIAERFAGTSNKGTAMGIFVTAQYAANSASLAVTGLLMLVTDWRNAYFLISIVSGMGLLLSLILLRDKEVPKNESESGGLRLSVLKNPMIRSLIYGYSTHAFVLFAVRVWLPIFLTAILVARGRGVDEAAVTGASIAGIALALGSVGPIMGGALSDRVGRLVSASMILGISAICSLIIGWTTDLPFGIVIAISVVYGWATAADSPIYQTAATEVSNSNHLGSTLAMQAFIGLLGGVSGPIVFGGILDLVPETIKWGVGFSVLGILAFIAIIWLLSSRSIPENLLLYSGKK
ncbi:MAG: MFS transporter [SAR202 cluster bacterium]|jgi:MFS family permease|nr:MFS transporter [SAR202 cluster bacterium]